MPPQRPGGARVDSGNPGTKGLSELDGKLPNPERLRGGHDRDRTCDPYHVNESAQPGNRFRSTYYAPVGVRTSADRSRNGSGLTRNSRATPIPANTVVILGVADAATS